LYRKVVSERACLYPGIAETLRKLKEKGYHVAVFSDKRQAFGQLELEQAGISGLLGHVLFLHDGRPYKLHPLGLKKVMEALEASPEETLYVGDSHQDIECAHRAGVKSAAALWGSVNRERVLAQRPHYQVETVEDITPILG
jgi:pyrophosphatase PpaX